MYGLGLLWSCECDLAARQPKDDRKSISLSILRDKQNRVQLFLLNTTMVILH
jgi:hypothetical protein